MKDLKWYQALLVVVFLLQVILWACGCKKPAPLPPPMSEGACKVQNWISRFQVASTCDFEHFRYQCTAIGDDFSGNLYQCLLLGPTPGETLPGHQ